LRVEAEYVIQTSFFEVAEKACKLMLFWQHLCKVVMILLHSSAGMSSNLNWFTWTQGDVSEKQCFAVISVELMHVICILSVDWIRAGLNQFDFEVHFHTNQVPAENLKSN